MCDTEIKFTISGMFQLEQSIEGIEPIDWAFAASIIVKVRNYLGIKAIEGLDIPQKRDWMC